MIDILMIYYMTYGSVITFDEVRGGVDGNRLVNDDISRDSNYTLTKTLNINAVNYIACKRYYYCDLAISMYDMKKILLEYPNHERYLVIYILRNNLHN